MDKVSVIIPAHNAATTIGRALTSVAVQEDPALEVIVFDDASVDGTPDVVESFADIDLTLIRSAENVGAAEARNRAVDAATGSLIAFLDADDAWLPGKMAAQRAVLEENPDATLIYCEALEFLPGGKELGFTNGRFARPQGAEAWKILLRESCVTTSCVLTRKTVFEQVGGFRKELLSGQDQDLWIRLALAGDLVYQPETFVHYFILGQSLSQSRHKFAVGDLLPIIEGYVDQNRDRLSDEEVQGILRARTLNKAKALYRAGDRSEANACFARARHLGIPAASLYSFKAKNGKAAQWVRRKQARPPIQLANMTLAPGPKLMVVVDTEEEFDWSAPFDRANRSVENIPEQERAHQFYDPRGLMPTYVIDDPVVSDARAVSSLKAIRDRGACNIGAHLHPWVSEPYDEEVCNKNSYPGNLPFTQEFLKLKGLTEKITVAFGDHPTAYKAGRYGFGKSTPKILETLGYKIDLSIVPYTDFTKNEGPDFEKLPPEPFWLGDRFELLTIPLSRGFTGVLRGQGRHIFPFFKGRSKLARAGLSILSRSNLLERITLSPEGMTLSEMKRLTKAELAAGRQIFTLTYHSSSLLPGGSPYVATEADRDAFLKCLKEYLNFFFDELGGTPITPSQIYENALKDRPDLNS